MSDRRRSRPGSENITWLRLLYAHPARFSDELIDVIAKLPKVLPYVDIPVQHISQKILKRMGRPVSPDRIYSLIEKLRESIGGVVLRTSLMVGFPGEKEADFRELVDFVERVSFERLGAFVYSEEVGTGAATLGDKVPADTAYKRYETIMAAQADIFRGIPSKPRRPRNGHDNRFG